MQENDTVFLVSANTDEYSDGIINPCSMKLIQAKIVSFERDAEGAPGAWIKIQGDNGTEWYSTEFLFTYEKLIDMRDNILELVKLINLLRHNQKP